MSILVLTGYDDRLDWAPLAERSWELYAKFHRYDFHCHRDYPPSMGHPSWQKLRLLSSLLPSYEWIFWTDIDSVVTNPLVKLEPLIDPSYPVIASRDWGLPADSPWSAGHMFFRQGRESASILKLASTKVQHMNAPLWDQNALQEVFREFADFKDRVKILDRRILNAVPTDAAPSFEPWQPGDFLAHITGHIKNPDKGPVIEKYAKLNPLFSS